MVDLSIVLSKDYNTYVQAIPHITAIVLCIFMGISFRWVKSIDIKEPTDNGGIRIIQSARSGNQSIIEFPRKSWQGYRGAGH